MLHIVGVNKDVDGISCLVVGLVTSRRSLKLVGLLGLGVCPFRKNSASHMLPLDRVSSVYEQWSKKFNLRYSRHHPSAMCSVPAGAVEKTHREHKQHDEEQEIHATSFLSPLRRKGRCAPFAV